MEERKLKALSNERNAYDLIMSKRIRLSATIYQTRNEISLT